MVEDLILTLAEKGILINYSVDELIVNAPKGTLDEALINSIKSNKNELIRFLSTGQLGRPGSDTIGNVPGQSSYLLSSSQRRLWILSRSDGGNAAYNIPGVYSLEGELDLTALSSAFDALISRHEILRTVFRENEAGEVRQYIQPYLPGYFTIQQHDLRQAADQEGVLRSWIDADSTAAFYLSEGPLLRASLYRVAEGRWVLTYVTHHIISDGWSMGVLIKELLSLYRAHVEGIEPALSTLRIQYKDYAGWQQSRLAGGQLEPSRNYWLQQLSGSLPVLDLPAENVRPSMKTYNGAMVSVTCGPALKDRLQQLSQSCGGTLFMGLLSVVNVLLHRYSGQEDIIIGSPIAGRDNSDLEDQIGFYANTLALRTRFSGSDSFVRILELVKEVTLGSYEHQAYPFDELVNDLSLRRDMSRHPLFDVMVVFQKNETDRSTGKQSEDQLRIGSYNSARHVVAKFDMTFNFIEAAEAVYATIEYNRDIYSAVMMERMGHHLLQLMECLTATPLQAIGQVGYLGAKEKEQLLRDFNATSVGYPTNKTLVALFEEQVVRTPLGRALVSGEQVLTYTQLNALSNQLAGYLIAHYSIRPDEIVGIKLERSEWLIVSILGIMKSGGAYLPVDPDYPPDRIDYMVTDSACRVLIDEEELLRFLSERDTYSPEDPTPINKPGDLAYVIYTSGSTGLPKGVMIEHKNICSRIAYLHDNYQLTEADNMLFYRSYSFDGSIEEYLLPVLSGATCFIAPPDFKQDIVNNMIGYIDRYKITKVNMPPALLEGLFQFIDGHAVQRLSSLKHVVSGGDKLSARTIRDYSTKLSAVLHNTYGPTENTIDSTNWKLYNQQEVTRVPIGKPVPDSQAYILDNNEQLVPIGVSGEIYVSGSGLARGYLNQPELTREKFVANPFRKGELMYRTGDVGRWLEDGNIEFLGRKDDQVKIRGHRVELGEIESILQTEAAVLAAVVIARSNKQESDKELIAYVVSDDRLNIAELRTSLGRRLPAYMLPAHYIQLEQLPVTVNGKIDKKALPDPESLGLESGIQYVAPSTDTERQLVEVYEEVLKKQGIGIQDDFFVLGGDSIKSILIASRLKQRGYGVTIQDIMSYPVIGDLALKVRSEIRLIDQELVSSRVPLGPIQHWFFRNVSRDHHHYNQSVLLYSKTAVQEPVLRHVLDDILLHHDALRMVYYNEGGEWIQENRGREQGYSLEVVEVGADGDIGAHCDRIQSGINLQEGPLLKVCLLRGADGDRLLLVAHHLVIDGVSWRILFEDIASLYVRYQSGAAAELPAKTDAFHYWMERQVEYGHSEAMEEEAAYWSAIESAQVDPLPVDHPGGSNVVKDTASYAFELDAWQTERLQTQCYKAYRTDINDILLGSLSIALREVFGMDRVVVNLEGHGRELIGADVDISRTVGWFTSVYPVLLDTGAGLDMIEQVVQVKEVLHRVPNKGIGYGILRYLGGKDYRLEPGITFNYLGDFGAGVSTREGGSLFEFSGEYHGREVSDNIERGAVLNITGMIVEGRLRLSVGYSHQQYEAATIEKLWAACQASLVKLIDSLSGFTATSFVQPVRPIAQKEILDPSWNQLHYLAEWGVKNAVTTGVAEYTGVDVEAFKAAVQTIIERHAILRTSFINIDGKIKQQVIPVSEFDAGVVEVHSAPSREIMEAIFEERAAAPFDVYEAPLFRITLCVLEKERLAAHFIIDHTLADGYSLGVLTKELDQLLQANNTDSPELSPLPFQYSDFVKWQKDFLTSFNGLKHKNYWLKRLEGAYIAPEIMSTGEGYGIESKSILYGKLYEDMVAFGKERQLTNNMILLGAFNLLLHLVNQKNDIALVSTFNGRSSLYFDKLDISGLIGYFSNLVILRNQVNEQDTAAKYLDSIKSNYLEDLIYGLYPFARLVQEHPGIKPSAGFLGKLLYYNYQNYDFLKDTVYGNGQQDNKESRELQCIRRQVERSEIMIIELKNGIEINCSLRHDAITPSWLPAIGRLYLAVLEQLIYHPKISILEGKKNILQKQ